MNAGERMRKYELNRVLVIHATLSSSLILQYEIEVTEGKQ